MKFVKGIATLTSFIMFSNATVALATEIGEFNKTVEYSKLADFNNDGGIDIFY